MSQKPISFADKIIASKGHLVQKFKAIDATGKQAYYFVLIEKNKEGAFKKALEKKEGMLNFEDYGKIIASCYGDEPTAEIKQMLKDKYGWDDV